MQLEKDEIWVEGDNPGFSLDSRKEGPFKTEDIFGKIVFMVRSVYFYPHHF